MKVDVIYVEQKKYKFKKRKLIKFLCILKGRLIHLLNELQFALTFVDYQFIVKTVIFCYFKATIPLN